ncbi:hypothetical protein TrRE_jg7949, partial [Triparma retinervis]
ADAIPGELYPWSWEAGDEDNFKAFGDGRLFVPPILTKLIFDREPERVIKWAEDVGGWDFTRVITAHYNNDVRAKPEEFKRAFDVLKGKEYGVSRVLPEDLELLQKGSDKLTKFGVVAETSDFWTPDRIHSVRSSMSGALSSNHLHCNAAGACPSPDSVISTLTTHLRKELEVGGYAAADGAADTLGGTYENLEMLINAPAGSVALHDSSTSSFTHGIHSIPLDEESVIIRLSSELSKPGRRVAAVVLTHAPTNGGLINNAEGIGEMIKKLKDPPLFLLDACQTVGQVELDVVKLKVDLMAGTSRKWLRGPRGVGFLYVNPTANLLEPSHLDLRGATWVLDNPSSKWTFDYEVDKSAKRYEFWEGSVANKLAFGRAVEIAREIGVGNIRERVRGLADMTRSMVESELGMRCMDVRDGEVKELSGICSFDASPLGGAD